MFRGAVTEMLADPVLSDCVKSIVSTPVLVSPDDSEKAVPPWNVIIWAVLLPLAVSVILLTLETANDVVPVMAPPSV